MLYIGCHLSSSRGLAAMGRQALELGANTFQFFTRNPRGSRAKPLDEADAAALTALLESHAFAPIIAHAPYTLNLCAAVEDRRTFAWETLADDLGRMEHLPGQLYNLHPGSHVGQGPEAGAAWIAQALNTVLRPEQTTTVLLETMSGKGTEVGSRFEELREILDRVVLAAESDMLTAVEALERRISRKRSRVELKTIRTRYPMGAEKQIVQSVTRREVPPGGRAEDVRCVVFNVSAAFAVGEALNKGLPLTHRAVTVTGGAVARPRNLWVPLGTPLKELVSSAGGFREEPGLILVGGPMTGVTQKSLEAPVLPNTNGLLCLAPWEQPREQAPTVCIRCGQCVSVCPMHLSPIFVVRALKENAAERLHSLHPQDCMDCGCCTYICPAHIPLADLVRQAAGQVRELEKGGDLHG